MAAGKKRCFLRFLLLYFTEYSRGGGTDLKRGYGDVRPWRPLFTPLLQFARVPFQAKVSVHKAAFWENLEILASTASIFAQIYLSSPQIWKFSALKPSNWEIFRSQVPIFGNFQLTSPPFQRQVSLRKPLASEIRAAHPYLKKKLCAPPRASPPSFKVRGLQMTMNFLKCKYISVVDIPTQILPTILLFIDCSKMSRKRINQGRSQTLNLGWAREEHFLIFPHYSVIFFHFSSICPHFLPQFDAPGGRLAHPGRPWLRHWNQHQDSVTKE